MQNNLDRPAAQPKPRTTQGFLAALSTLLLLMSLSTLAEGDAEAALSQPVAESHQREALPEPTALLLLGAGLALAASLGRRAYPKR